MKERENKLMKKLLTIILCAAIVLGFAACNPAENTSTTPSGGLNEVAGDYYINLTDLGMKLTIYLRINEDGTFLFSNNTDFDVNKSAGTAEKVEDGYMMVYNSVNGEERSISEGLTSKFIVAEDGSLDFTVCDRIYYGTATATTTSAEYPDARLIAYIIPEDYETPSNETEFTEGTYKALYTDEEGVSRTYCISFYEDSSYMLFSEHEENGIRYFETETGRFGISTTQLALNPTGENRVSCEVLNETELLIKVPAEGRDEREDVVFAKSENAPPALIGSFSGTGQITGQNEDFSGELNIYEDGSFEAEAGGFTETGLITLSSSEGIYKIYPDHPSTGKRGLNQVATVPSDSFTYGENGKIILNDFRVRLSEDLTRDKCTFTER